MVVGYNYPILVILESFAYNSMVPNPFPGSPRASNTNINKLWAVAGQGSRLFVMVGTNDLLELQRSRAGPRSVVLRQMKDSLRNFLIALKKLELNITLVTIPPLPKLLHGDTWPPVTVEEFNGMLCPRAYMMGTLWSTPACWLQVIEVQAGRVIRKDGVQRWPTCWCKSVFRKTCCPPLSLFTALPYGAKHDSPKSNF